jgi:hypothetical protein
MGEARSQDTEPLVIIARGSSTRAHVQRAQTFQAGSNPRHRLQNQRMEQGDVVSEVQMEFEYETVHSSNNMCWQNER